MSEVYTLMCVHDYMQAKQYLAAIKREIEFHASSVEEEKRIAVGKSNIVQLPSSYLATLSGKLREAKLKLLRKKNQGDKIDISKQKANPEGNGEEIMLQGFNWDSWKDDASWYETLSNKVDSIADAGFTVIWLPPPTDSVSPEGYMPRDLYCLNSKY